MFGNLVPLHREKHKDLRFTPLTSHAHAAAERGMPVVSAECEAASQEHVIVFGAEPGTLPQLLVGLSDGRNAYVDAQGQWQARYVPALVRHYPFALIEKPASQNASEAQRSFLLALVPEAPHFADAAGQPLLDDAGGWSAWLDQAQRALSAMRADAERTQFMVQQLDDAGLIEAADVPVFLGKTPESGYVPVRGLRMLNVAAFNALTDGQRTALTASGAYALAQAHLHSVKNLAGGPLSAAAQELAAAAQGSAANPPAAARARFLDPDALAAAKAEAAKRPALVPFQPSPSGLFASTNRKS